MSRRIISLVVLVTFLFSNVSFASDLYRGNPPQGNINLAPPLLCGPLGDEDHKLLKLAEIGLELDLLEIDKFVDIDKATDKAILEDAFKKSARLKEDRKYKEDTIYSPAEVTTYFTQLEHIGGNIFAIPVSVEKRYSATRKVRKDYRLLFSTIRRDGGFPSVICTKEDLDTLRSKIRELNQLPQLTKEDAMAMARYGNHEKSVDNGAGAPSLDEFIKERIRSGNFAELQGRANDLQITSRYPDAIRPKTYWRDSILDDLKLELNGFLRNLGTNVERSLKGKNIVFIRAPKDSFPYIEENGLRIRVGSHTSQNTVYIFIDEPLFDEFDGYANTDIPGGLEDITEGRIRIEEQMNMLLQARILHEIAAIHNLPYRIVEINAPKKEAALANDIYQAYRDYKANPEIIGKLLKTFPELAKLRDGPVDLDRNLKSRDYASGILVPIPESNIRAARALDDYIKKARDDGRDRLYEFEIYDVLKLLGVNVPQYTVINDPDNIPQLPRAAKKMVLKIISSSLHKSDETIAGGMVRGVEIVATEEAPWFIRKMFMIPGAKGVLVYPFVENASGPSELLIGFTDADLGRLICFGQGGLYTDYRPDRAYRDYRLGFSAEELIASTDIGKQFIYGNYRSRQLPLKAGELEALIEKFAAFKRYYDEHGEFAVSDLEINPLMCLPDGQLFACDAKLEFTQKKPAAKVKPVERLRKLLHPRSVGVTGVVSDRWINRVGAAIPRILDNLIRTWKGPLYIKGETGGVAYKGVKLAKEVPDDCDLCIVLNTPKEGVTVAKDRLAKGSAVVLIGAGFGEVEGDAATKLNQALQAAIDGAHPDGSLVGPNTMGIITPELDALFSDESAGVKASKDSNIAFISQSGAFLAAAASSLALRNTYIHYGFSIGNAADLGAADYLEYIIENEPQIKVVAMYLEASGGNRIGALIRRAHEKGISVIIRKGGTTEEGAKSTVSHTASSAGKFEHFKAVLEQAGAVVLPDTGNYDLWVDTVYAASHFAANGFPKGNRIFAMSSGGEDAVAMTDAQAVSGKAVFPQPDEALRSFMQSLKILNTVKNPFDITAGTSVDKIKQLLEYAGSSDTCDLLLFAYLRWLPPLAKDRELIQYIKDHKGSKPLVMILKDDSDTGRAVKKELREAGVLVFDTPQRAIFALGAVLKNAAPSALPAPAAGKPMQGIAGPEGRGSPYGDNSMPAPDEAKWIGTPVKEEPPTSTKIRETAVSIEAAEKGFLYEVMADKKVDIKVQLLAKAELLNAGYSVDYKELIEAFDKINEILYKEKALGDWDAELGIRIANAFLKSPDAAIQDRAEEFLKTIVNTKSIYLHRRAQASSVLVRNNRDLANQITFLKITVLRNPEAMKEARILADSTLLGMGIETVVPAKERKDELQSVVDKRAGMLWVRIHIASDLLMAGINEAKNLKLLTEKAHDREVMKGQRVQASACMLEYANKETASMNAPQVPPAASGVQLAHLARHEFINALIKMFLGLKKEDKEGFLLEQTIDHIKFYWFGEKYTKNRTFLDLFNKLVDIEAVRRGRIVPNYYDEINVAKQMVRLAGLNKTNVDKNFLRELKQRLGQPMIEHLSVYKNNAVYAMRAHIGIAVRIKDHAKLEAAIHRAAIEGTFKGDRRERELEYEKWREHPNSVRNVALRIEDERISLHQAITLNELSQWAHDRAEERYPLSERTMPAERDSSYDYTGREYQAPPAGIGPSGDSNSPTPASARPSDASFLPQDEPNGIKSIFAAQGTVIGGVKKEPEVLEAPILRGVDIGGEKQNIGGGLVLVNTIPEYGQPVSVTTRNTALPAEVVSLLEQLKIMVPAQYSDKMVGTNLRSLQEFIEGKIEKKFILDDESGLIFSEGVAFGERIKPDQFNPGLAPFLAELAMTGVHVAVVAKTDVEKNIIDGLNLGRPENQKILYADNVDGARSRLNARQIQRCAYVKLETEECSPSKNYEILSVTAEQIIRLLGTMRNITNEAVIQQMIRAGVVLAQAA